MDAAKGMVGALMWIGAGFWIASIVAFLQTLAGTKPGARARLPLLLFKPDVLNEYGLRSQGRFKLFCCGYCLCWGGAILIVLFIALATRY